ncbi:CBS domain-containing protein [Pedobacter sp. JY14-1]|uniref:CBS domain-containing protein n=1 Tax=Pedobacter sp. JY14-1 TaxID=3034151 RepID=UPI0023E183C0|nr:CBS domain-containing protein [Pedobacter sp. JY14-1]
MIKSHIRLGHVQYEPREGQPKIDAETLVVTALEVMLNSREFELPVYDNGKCIGMVCFKDLIQFLGDKKLDVDHFMHKLNFTVESAIIVLQRDF